MRRLMRSRRRLCLLGEENAVLKAAHREFADAETELHEPRNTAERKLAKEQSCMEALAEERKERLEKPPPVREDALKMVGWSFSSRIEGREEQLFCERRRAEIVCQGVPVDAAAARVGRGAAARELGARGCGAARAGAARKQ